MSKQGEIIIELLSHKRAFETDYVVTPLFWPFISQNRKGESRVTIA